MPAGPKYGGKKLVVVNIGRHQDTRAELDGAIKEIQQALEEGKLDIYGKAIETRNKLADYLIMEIQNKIWANGSVVTGRMWGSVSRDPEYQDPHVPSNIFYPVDVGPNVFYAKYVEEVKPFMEPTWEKNKELIFKTIEEAIRDVGE